MINKFIQTLLAVSDTKANTTRMHGEYVANHIQSFDQDSHLTLKKSKCQLKFHNSSDLFLNKIVERNFSRERNIRANIMIVLPRVHLHYRDTSVTIASH